MEEGLKEQRAHGAHCLVIPFPIQGHINPMLQFCKRLEHKSVRVTLVTTRFLVKTIADRALSTSIRIETISDGYDEDGYEKAESVDAYLDSFTKVGSQTLTNLIDKLNGSCSDSQPVDCVVYDTFLPWCLDVAKKFGLIGAAFLTQSCAVDSIYYHLHQGMIKLPLSEVDTVLPGLPPLRPQDMPTFMYYYGSNPTALNILLGQFSNIEKADWVLCNTFYDLEQEVVDWLAKIWPLKTIGPTVPSMFLDKQIEDDIDYGFSLFRPSHDACLNWLNEKPIGSVVYVSFGSMVALSTEQIEELSQGLKGSNYYFLWVLRTSEQGKLPGDFLTEETKEKALVVPWCQQLEVLSHEAIGCFVTHCGWNSTLEALSLGVPMVAMPQWSDQSTNAKYITDVWKMGLRASADDGERIVRGEAIMHCIREIMVGQTGKEIKINVEKWRELATKAMDEGGSSGGNINDFVASLIQWVRIGTKKIDQKILQYN